MPLLPLNSVGGYSTGITGTTVIDANGNITGVGATFSSLARFNAGISAAGGITFNSDVTINSLNTLYLSNISSDSGSIIYIGDVHGVGNNTYILVRDGVSALSLANPYGQIVIGDAENIDTGNYIYYEASTGALNGNANSSIVNFNSASINGIVSVGGLLTASAGISAAGGTFSALTGFNAGISAAGGVTFGGTVASDTGYSITSNAINAQTGTTYTFLSSDNGKVVTFNNGSTTTVTIPTGLPVGFNCTAIQLGAGQVGFTAASGVTMNAYASAYKISGQHGAAALISYTTNIFNLSGTLSV